MPLTGRQVTKAAGVDGGPMESVPLSPSNVYRDALPGGEDLLLPIRL